MSAWPGKFVIGLTGNIATGKSLVRKMLEHAGAFGIDADALSNRAILRGAPGYQPVLDAFGQFLLDEHGEIDRNKLAQIVFYDPKALKVLESIVHPLVREAVNFLVNKSRSRVVVIEAIKLLESPIKEACDTVWVTTSTRPAQISRLKEKRGMSLEEAGRRMVAQSPQEEKVAQADTVINNDGSIMDAWNQVRAALELILPDWTGEDAPMPPHPDAVPAHKGTLRVERAGPAQAEIIAEFMSTQDPNTEISAAKVMDYFGEKAFLLVKQGDQLGGLLGWKVENLVARVDDVYLTPRLLEEKSLRRMMGEVEEASRELQCEVALLFLPPPLARYTDLWAAMDYRERVPESLEVTAWQEAALESLRDGATMLFKKLRSDRVLKPI